jgi:hypothetical protein
VVQATDAGGPLERGLRAARPGELSGEARRGFGHRRVAHIGSLAGGKRLLLVGQKSGVMWALDPDAEGKVVWQQRLGKGGVLGGIMFGPAADAEKVYVPLSDYTMRGPIEGGDPKSVAGCSRCASRPARKLGTAPPPEPKCIGTLGCTPRKWPPPR